MDKSKEEVQKLLKLLGESGYDIVPRKASLFTLYSYQENTNTALDICNHVMVKSARQMGKTTFIKERIRSFLNGFDHKRILIISPNTGMKDHVNDMLRKMIEEEYVTVEQITKERIKLKNKFEANIEIEFWSSNQNIGTKTCGRSYDCLYIDEMAFMKFRSLREFWYSYWPVHSSKKSTESIFISSNYDSPSDCEDPSFFEELWRHDSSFAKIIWNIWERPDFTKEWMHEQRECLGKNNFGSSYMVP